MTRVRLNMQSLTGEASQHAEISLENPTVLGRDPSSPLSLSGDAISRRHCQLEARDGTVYLTDLSANGTWLNGTRLSVGKSVVVPGSSVIELPDYQISVDFPYAPDPVDDSDVETTQRLSIKDINLSGQEILVALLLAAALLVAAVYWFL